MVLSVVTQTLAASQRLREEGGRKGGEGGEGGGMERGREGGRGRTHNKHKYFMVDF